MDKDREIKRMYAEMKLANLELRRLREQLKAKDARMREACERLRDICEGSCAAIVERWYWRKSDAELLAAQTARDTLESQSKALRLFAQWMFDCTTETTNAGVVLCNTTPGEIRLKAENVLEG